MNVADPKAPASKLAFTGDANFEAGSSNSGGAGCAGITVVSWSSTKVVPNLGNAYGTFDHRYLTHGDGYAISIKTAIWEGHRQRAELDRRCWRPCCGMGPGTGRVLRLAGAWTWM